MSARIANQTMPGSLFELNLAALRRWRPELAARLDTFTARDRVRILKARDGSFVYGFIQGEQVVLLTAPNAPAARMQAQLDQQAAALADFTRPVLIIGLYPGHELLAVFDHSENITTPHCPQPIHVCLDSIIGLYAYLQCWDARRVIASRRVHFFWHEDAGRFAEHLRAHPEQPHVFSLLTLAPDRTVAAVLEPLGRLVTERNAALPEIMRANDAYYDALGDAELARIIAGRGGRPPRLLLPTCSWSTFIQHSARDTAAAFEQAGWQTRLLNADAMLTPYHLARQINEFKPDVFLFIDHLRHEAEEVYPRNLLFVTWVQDDMPNIQSAAAGARFAEYAARRRRDFVIGHVDRLAETHGYPADRLFKLQIPADPRVFHPVALTREEQRAYACDVAFMSNVSLSSERVVTEVLVPALAPVGFSATVIQAIHDHLWTAYRAGRTFTDRDALLKELRQFPDFAGVWDTPPEKRPRPVDNEHILRLFLWRLNDTIYRHVVLEWADELGLDLRLYGHGWDRHPRFRRYAQPPLAHGAELNVAYQAARLCLHLNITQGMHQRLWEILAAGARPLFRVARRASADTEPVDEMMRALARRFYENRPPAEEPIAIRERLNKLIYGFCAAALAAPGADAADAARAVARRIEDLLRPRPEWWLPDAARLTFQDRAEFGEKVRAWLDQPPSGGMRARNRLPKCERLAAEFYRGYICKR